MPSRVYVAQRWFSRHCSDRADVICVRTQWHVVAGCVFPVDFMHDRTLLVIVISDALTAVQRRAATMLELPTKRKRPDMLIRTPLDDDVGM